MARRARNLVENNLSAAGRHRYSLSNRRDDGKDFPSWLSCFIRKTICDGVHQSDESCELFKLCIWNKFSHLNLSCPNCQSEKCVAECGICDFLKSRDPAEACDTPVIRKRKAKGEMKQSQAEKDYQTFFKPLYEKDSTLPGKIDCLGCHKFLEQEICAHICTKMGRASNFTHRAGCKSILHNAWKVIGHELSLAPDGSKMFSPDLLSYRGCKNGGPKSNNTVRICTDCCHMYTNSRRCTHMELAIQNKKSVSRTLQNEDELLQPAKKMALGMQNGSPQQQQPTATPPSLNGDEASKKSLNNNEDEEEEMIFGNIIPDPSLDSFELGEENDSDDDSTCSDTSSPATTVCSTHQNCPCLFF